MALQLSQGVATGEMDASGATITASYWKIVEVSANVLNQQFSCTLNGYASAAAFNASPHQIPIAQQQINFPDTNVSANWPFDPATLAANYPNNPQAFLLAAQAYCLLFPMFSGASQVA